jgi:hypothetical protein
MNELKEEEREQKRKYLLEQGWYQLWHKDNWLQRGKRYEDPDRSGLTTESAYQMQKHIEKSNGNES